jgi:hypothetical protein
MGTSVAVAVGLGVGGTGVKVGEGVDVGRGVEVGGTGVGVGGTGVSVGSDVAVGTIAVGVEEGISDGTAVLVSSATGGEAVAEGDGESSTDGAGVEDSVGVGETSPTTVGETVAAGSLVGPQADSPASTAIESRRYQPRLDNLSLGRIDPPSGFGNIQHDLGSMQTENRLR